jgi:methyl-accepting chemotaxis protein
MQALRSISARMIVAITLVAAGSCASIAGFGMWQQRATVDVALERESRADYANLEAAVDAEARTVRVVSQVLASVKPIKDVSAARDRPAAITLLKEAQQILLPQGIEILAIHIPPALSFVRVHKPTAFGDDLSGRRQMIVQAVSGKQALGGIEAGLTDLTVFGSTPMLDGDTVIGVVDIGAPFGKTFVNAMKARFGFDVAIHQLDGQNGRTLASTLAGGSPDVTAIRRALAGEVFVRQGEIDGRPIATAFGPIKNFSGAPVAVFEIVRDTSVYGALATRSLTWLLIATGCALLLAGAIAFWLGRGMARPIQALELAMRGIASGQHQIVIPGASRRDEIGSMAKAVEVFKQGLIETETMRAEQSEVAARQTRQRHADNIKLAADFESAVGLIIEGVSSASAELETSAGTLTSTAERAQELTTMVAAASEEASTNVQSVASATEEMSSSVNEISRQVQESARIASEAVDQAQKTNDRVSALAQAATRIGDVVELINTIAGQTNLLALNATIEAARAGEAGRGFAVVASEVKALAEQTAKATGEIGQQISGIQAATQESVHAIMEIGHTIGRMSEISSTIASAVEEQGAATQEISRNVQQAAQGTHQVSANIADVQHGAIETGTASAQVLSAAQSLSRDSHRLKLEVGKFLDTVRAA